MFNKLATAVGAQKKSPCDFVVVDEAQDFSISYLRFFAALEATRANALFFACDVGQRIFQQPFSWKARGVDIRGRAKTLRVNYRASHQIRSHADRLLGPTLRDIEGNAEDRNDTVSVFNGPAPQIEKLKSDSEKIGRVAAWLVERTKAGMMPHEIGIFVRTRAQLERSVSAVVKAAIPYQIVDDRVDATPGHLSIGIMHLAKGLEFRAVAVMACDDADIPLQERIEAVGDEADLLEVYDTERQLLYVTCTRARDCLLVNGVKPASEFLDDLHN